jgi:hypothetical protein
MNAKDLCDLLDVLAPLPEEETLEWLLHELNIKPDEKELVWA